MFLMDSSLHYPKNNAGDAGYAGANFKPEPWRLTISFRVLWVVLTRRKTCGSHAPTAIVAAARASYDRHRHQQDRPRLRALLPMNTPGRWAGLIKRLREAACPDNWSAAAAIEMLEQRIADKEEMIRILNDMVKEARAK